MVREMIQVAMSTAVDNNILNAGEFFMKSLWIQGQMADLIILKKHPKIRRRFVERMARIPTTLRDCRMLYWQKEFSAVKDEFERQFSSLLSSAARDDLMATYLLRNTIAHSHVSLAREFLFYRPSGKGRKTQVMMKAFNLSRSPDSAKPTLFKLSFANIAFYLRFYSRAKLGCLTQRFRSSVFYSSESYVRWSRSRASLPMAKCRKQKRRDCGRNGTPPTS
jgi:hypothetical protein